MIPISNVISISDVIPNPIPDVDAIKLNRAGKNDGLILWPDMGEFPDDDAAYEKFRQWWRLTSYGMKELDLPKGKPRMRWGGKGRTADFWKCYIEAAVFEYAYSCIPDAPVSVDHDVFSRDAILNHPTRGLIIKICIHLSRSDFISALP